MKGCAHNGDAYVNLRTDKIMPLTPLDDRTLVEQYDVSGTFDFSENSCPRTSSGRSLWRTGTTCGPSLNPWTKSERTTNWPWQTAQGELKICQLSRIEHE